SVIGGASTKSIADTLSATRATIDGRLFESAGAQASADATNTITATLKSRGGSIADVRGVVASANVNAAAATTALISGGLVVSRPGGAVTVSSTASNSSNLTSDTVAAGLVGVTLGSLDARVDSPTTATLDTEV